jgi:thiol-disulfide isomerase/thioredoxin
MLEDTVLRKDTETIHKLINIAKGMHVKRQYPPYIDRLLKSIDTQSYGQRMRALLDSGHGKFVIHNVDTLGNQFSDEEAYEMLLSGQYDHCLYIDQDIYWKKDSHMMEDYFAIRPSSSNFIAGDFLPLPKLKGLNNIQYDEKSLNGKFLVVNFWFISCMPCRKEFPVLNKLVSQYKGNNKIIFLGITPDSALEVKRAKIDLIFKYTIVPNTSSYISTLNLKDFPTHVIIGPDRRILFSCTEGGERAIYWIRKTIDSCLTLKPARP